MAGHDSAAKLGILVWMYMLAFLRRKLFEVVAVPVGVGCATAVPDVGTAQRDGTGSFRSRRRLPR